MNRSIVLLSGGLDSTVALAAETLATDDNGTIEALTVDYGQQHRREIDHANQIAYYYGVQHRVVVVDPVIFGDPTGLIDAPLTITTVLLALAAARAEAIGAHRIVIGSDADDAGDHRQYINTMNTLSHNVIHAPLLPFTKRQVVKLARKMGVPTYLSWSCTEGLAAGPCGHCDACIARDEAERKATR